MNICIIPARGNSKRIVNKNILNFFGKPIISYPIQIAKKSRLFKKIIVSTDSKKIANISIKYGAEVFTRPKKISGRNSPIVKTIEHTLNILKNRNIYPRLICILYPCNPILKISTLLQCKKLLLESKVSSVITVGRYSYPIQRALKKDKFNYFIPREKKNKFKMSQDLEQFYQDAAQCYWYNLRKIKNFRDNFKTKALELKKFEYQDVDNVEDLENLKNIYKFNLHKK